VRDSETGQLWSPTAQPIRDGGRYVARHGFGFCRFEHEAQGIALDLLQYVPLDDPVKISRLTLTNRTGRPRRLSVTAFADWALGASRAASAPHVITEIDTDTGALMARNPWSTAFPGRVAFADLAGEQTSLTGDRTAFLGQGGGLHAPAGLLSGQPLSGATGAGYDPCAALSRDVALAPEQTVEVVFLLGQGGSPEAARGLIERYRAADLDVVLGQVTDHWAEVLRGSPGHDAGPSDGHHAQRLAALPDLACRIWARSGLLPGQRRLRLPRPVAGRHGAELRAEPALSARAPAARAGRQFVEGDVQHWWLPHSGQGVRTRISDDRVWLAFATAAIRPHRRHRVLDETGAVPRWPGLEQWRARRLFRARPAERVGLAVRALRARPRPVPAI
jgi:cyclic beta-1,2-glucan synthetase